MKKASFWFLVILCCGITASWAAGAPKCQAEEAAMNRAQAANDAAWKSSQAAWKKVGEAYAAYDTAAAEWKVNSDYLDSALETLKAAHAANLQCQLDKRKAGGCAAEQQAENAAIAKVKKADAGLDGAKKRMGQKFADYLIAESRADAALKKAEDAEKKYKDAVDAYTRCLKLPDNAERKAQ